MTARALTIAGSDPTGGAGIQQDLKTFAAFGVWGLSAVTALTVQDTHGVSAWERVDASMVRAQIDTVLNDIGCDAAKTGMLGTEENVEAVAEAVADHRIRALVVDPVLATGGGSSLADEGFLEVLREVLLPHATLITPNVLEAAALAGLSVETLDEQKEVAVALAALGPDAVLVTGGHVEGPRVTDVLFAAGELHELRSDRLDSGDVHGTGCALSAAVTACIAKGSGVEEAVRTAREAVVDAIARAKKLGKGARLLEMRG
jgi:hydroxymethylpyrimidine kinase/phosphomethylpyrimidine kinase